MTQTISRMYGSPDHAKAAVAELKKHSIYDGGVFMVAPPAAEKNGRKATEPSVDGIADTIMKGYVVKEDAKIYAEGVRRGGTLVTVHAPWGSAALAIDILARFEPIDSGIAKPTRPPLDSDDDASPLSWLLNIPVLYNNPTPFASLANLRTLTEGRASLSEALRLPELTRDGGPLFPVGIFTQAAPLSALFRMPTISDDPEPLSRLAKMPTLSSQPSPLSDKLNVSVLSSEPAPLSAALHVPPLTSEPTPLSSSLGAPTLTKD